MGLLRAFAANRKEVHLMIDVTKERVVSLAEACELLPRRRNGKRPDISCLYRWIKDGFRGEFLDHLQVGSTKCTSVEALTDFFERISHKPATRQTRASQQQKAKAAGQKLDALGITARRSESSDSTEATAQEEPP